MQRTVWISTWVLSANFLVAQEIPKAYYDFVKTADSLYNAKAFRQSADKYSEAFKANGWKGTLNDRYNAGCSWALAGVPDSAFFQLNRVATLMGYSDYNHITIDTDLNALHSDSRWKPLLEKIRANKDKSEAGLNKPLVAMLDSVYVEDQSYRMKLGDIEKKYGWDSKEMKDHWKKIREKDSINLVKIKVVLDKYGWLGPDVIGNQGNSTLFLVIQHADQGTQEKYLPMMREAVKNGKAHGSSLALLEDRVALGQRRRQTYGSQIGRDPDTQKYYVLPLDDPDNVDKRRASVGLGPLSAYVNQWQIKWDAEQYKKDLPELERKLKMK